MEEEVEKGEDRQRCREKRKRRGGSMKRSLIWRREQEEVKKHLQAQGAAVCDFAVLTGDVNMQPM